MAARQARAQGLHPAPPRQRPLPPRQQEVPPLNNGASVDDFNTVSTMTHWVMERIPSREGMPEVNPLLDSSRICANLIVMGLFCSLGA